MGALLESAGVDSRYRKNNTVRKESNIKANETKTKPGSTMPDISLIL